MSAADDVMQTIASMNTNAKAVYDMIEEMGGEIPTNKNLANMADAILTINESPSLAGLKRRLQNGTAAEKYPVGTEIPDKWNGNDNPLIVAQYLDSSNNSSYGGAVGVILVRKWVEPTSQRWGNDTVYNGSTVMNYLNTTYLSNCSEALKSVISDITVSQYNGIYDVMATGKLFLMSAYELCNKGINNASGYEGVMWDYWKQKTGLSTPDALYVANNGRIMTDRSGTALSIWLRTQGSYGENYVSRVYTNGSVDFDRPTVSYGVLPACFIAKD